MNKTFNASQPKGRVLCTEKKKNSLLLPTSHGNMVQNSNETKSNRQIHNGISHGWYQLSWLCPVLRLALSGTMFLNYASVPLGWSQDLGSSFILSTLQSSFKLCQRHMRSFNTSGSWYNRGILASQVLLRCHCWVTDMSMSKLYSQNQNLWQTT